MDAPPPIIIGLEGLIQHSLPRITRFRSAAAAMTNFGRLSPFLKRLQVSILLLGSIYRKFSQYDMIAGSDLCLGICHDSLVQTQGMIEAVLQAPEGDNVYNLGAEVLIERLPDEISSFISSVELLRSTYQESVEFHLLPNLSFLSLTMLKQITIRIHSRINEGARQSTKRLLQAPARMYAQPKKGITSCCNDRIE